CYAAAELTRIIGLRKSHVEVKKIEARVKYGVLEELLPLVSVKGIGRVRARKIFNTGIKTVPQLKNAPLEILTPILGKKTAEKIKREV
ncbi:MAG: restriction endonuclease subunit R, partial [Candidatus Altiarchaeota archaeon]|nr:restriction endonuclease subunit R [Candidatus Altiarchaeota archaeon]